MKIKFDFSPCFTFHGWKDYNYCHILPRMTLFTAPRWRSNWDEKLIGQHFDFTIGWLVFEVSIGMECLWKEPAKPKFKVGDHICNRNCSDAVVKAVNFDEGNEEHWCYQCLDLDRNSEDYDKYFYINAEIEHLWYLRKGDNIEELALDIVENSEPMPPEFAQLVNDNFWDLVDEQPGGREDG